jgi:hypothetical protein
MLPEIVRIGMANAHITCVTPQRLEYLNEAGEECFVDLEECFSRYAQLHKINRDDVDLLTSEEGAEILISRYVADRGFLDNPPWIEFKNKRRTRFQFASSNEALGVKLKLMRVRWRTFDAN